MSGLNSVPLNRRPTWEGLLGPIGRREYPQLHPSHHHIPLTVRGFIVRAQATKRQPPFQRQRSLALKLLPIFSFDHVSENPEIFYPKHFDPLRTFTKSVTPVTVEILKKKRC